MAAELRQRPSGVAGARRRCVDVDEPLLRLGARADVTRLRGEPGPELTLDEDVLWPSDVDPGISTTRGLERIVEGIVRNATDVYEPAWGEVAQLGSIGSSDDYRVVVVEGDCDFRNAVGYGVLLVRGELTVHGTFSWNGLVLVIGQGVVGSSDVVSGSISNVRIRLGYRLLKSSTTTFE